MTKPIDITRPMTNDLACWPGDRPTEVGATARIADGSSVNVGYLSISQHSGTHCDAPRHYRDDGGDIAALDIDLFQGPTLVLNVRGRKVILPEHLRGIESSEPVQRLLLHTGGYPDDRVFPGSIPVLHTSAADYLAEAGVRVLGVDLPSVDQLDDADLPIHFRLDAAGILIIEGLRLDTVAEGWYRMIALPLLIPGADGAPLRAVLYPQSSGD